MERLPLPQQRSAAVCHPMNLHGLARGGVKMHPDSQHSRGSSTRLSKRAGVAAPTTAPQRSTARVSASRSLGHGTVAPGAKLCWTWTETRRAWSGKLVGAVVCGASAPSGATTLCGCESVIAARCGSNNETPRECPMHAPRVRASAFNARRR